MHLRSDWLSIRRLPLASNPYWRFDGSDENEANKLNGGDNMKAVRVPATGKYLFEFDYALLRSRIIPIK